GFSRANLDLSMGYAAQSGETFFSRLLPGVERRRDGSVRSRPCAAQDCSWGKLKLVSDFLQDFVVPAAPFRPPQSKSRLALGETEVLLAAGRCFADHHSALAQI